MTANTLRAALVAAVLCAPAAAATPDCESLAAKAGAAVGVPDGVMAAIARVESGRGIGKGKRRAWPWTLNQGGKGSFHASMPEAQARAEALIGDGVRNLDLGCMQLNWRWHGAGFRNVAEMLDPVANTRYAAMFLSELARRNGSSWERAIALYHSADPERGPAYAAKVTAALQEIQAETGGPVTRLADTPTAPDTPSAPLSADAAHAARAEAAIRVAGLLALPQGPLVTTGAVADLRQTRAPGLGMPPLSRAPRLP